MQIVHLGHQWQLVHDTEDETRGIHWIMMPMRGPEYGIEVARLPNVFRNLRHLCVIFGGWGFRIGPLCGG